VISQLPSFYYLILLPDSTFWFSFCLVRESNNKKSKKKKKNQNHPTSYPPPPFTITFLFSPKGHLFFPPCFSNLITQLRIFSLFFAIRNFKKVENDHNYAHYQQHFCLDYDQIDNCHCDSN